MAGPITLLTSGTRGDAQPVVALGLGLRAAGRPVRLAAPPAFGPFIAPSGLDFAPVDGNPSDLLARPDAHAALNDSGNPVATLRGTLRYLREARPVYRRMLDNAWAACQGSSALVVGLPTMWGEAIAEALDVPLVWGLLQPFARTRAYPSALLPMRPRVGRAGSLLSHLLVEQAIWLPWRGIVNAWRARTLKLPPAPLLHPYRALYGPGASALYGYSPAVAPRTADWPGGHRVTGYWFWDRGADWRPPAGLEAFLAASPAAVSVSFGTAALREPTATLPRVVDAVARAGARAVIAAPAALHPLLSAGGRIFPIEAAPHDWLFARVAAAVHHGGAGTTGYSLRAGLPTLVIPHATDQFFWGGRIAALGAGPPPLALPALTADRLAGALRRLIDDADLRASAQRLGRLIQAEDGVSLAARIIDSALRTGNNRGVDHP